jgi:hypothetical protein
MQMAAAAGKTNQGHHDTSPLSIAVTKPPPQMRRKITCTHQADRAT